MARPMLLACMSLLLVLASSQLIPPSDVVSTTGFVADRPTGAVFTPIDRSARDRLWTSTQGSTSPSPTTTPASPIRPAAISPVQTTVAPTQITVANYSCKGIPKSCFAVRTPLLCNLRTGCEWGGLFCFTQPGFTLRPCRLLRTPLTCMRGGCLWSLDAAVPRPVNPAPFQRPSPSPLFTLPSPKPSTSPAMGEPSPSSTTGAAGKCTGSAWSCSGISSSSTCSIQKGCYWRFGATRPTSTGFRKAEVCSGSATFCSELDSEGPCGRQKGCHWTT